MAINRILIGESGGPTPVIDWEVAGILAAANQHGIEVLGAINGLEGLLNSDKDEKLVVDLTGMDPNRWMHNGPGAGLKTTRIKPDSPQYEKMVENLKRYNVDGVIYIGGNDSADQLLGLTMADPTLAAMHAIKTIDNDLRRTHHCPGWGSAALYNALAVKNVCSDFFGYGVRVGDEIVQAPVAVYQVMGRKAGWLAQATAFARVDPRGAMIEGEPPHIILSKENPVDMDLLYAAIENALSKYGHACIVVQEDLDDAAEGRSWSELYGADTMDSHRNVEHGRAGSFSPAAYLAAAVKAQLKVPGIAKIKDASFNPQHIQRSCMMSDTDAAEAYMIGAAAVKAMLDGASGQSVILERNPNGGFSTGLAPLHELAGKKTRPVPREYIQGMSGPTQAFVDEFIGVIGGPTALPHYSTTPLRPASR